MGQSRTIAGLRIDGVPAGDKSPRMAREVRVEYPGAIYPVMNYGGDERTETEVAKAGRVLNEELERRRKGDSQKIQMAQRLRTETTMTWSWIADHLRMGAGASAANRLRRG